jgi:hypothetical protein
VEYSLSKHAIVVMSERELDESYLKKTLEYPELILDDSID